jgi:hypothetical protein
MSPSWGIKRARINNSVSHLLQSIIKNPKESLFKDFSKEASLFLLVGAR